MTKPDELDEALRGKLRAAAEQVPAPRHSHEYQERLSRAVLERAQADAPSVRPTRIALGAGMVLAAAAALLLMLRPDLESTQSAQSAQPAPSTPACALPTEVAFHAGPAASSELNLGAFGSLRAEPGSEVRVVHSSACLLTLELERGFLAGDLAKLKPAKLRVRTPHGTVVVRGTRFSVRSAEELEVVLLSGRVDIENGDTQVLEPQQVFRARGKTRQRLGAQPDQARRIADLLTAREPVRAREPAPTLEQSARQPASASPALSPRSRELLARAESARRSGKLEEARSLYAQASAGRDGDAEVALLRWSRLELDARAFSRVAQLLTRHARRFEAGTLHAEAAWLRVLMLREQGDQAAARSAARALIERFPRQPQAQAAEALLRGP